MKQGIHPDYHPIVIVMTDGVRYETRSTWGKAGDVLQLDVDPKTHPAWIGGVSYRKTGQMEKFKSKYGAFGEKAVTGSEPQASADEGKKAVAVESGKAAAHDKK
jgi:large subunit ribosomal protein L31